MSCTDERLWRPALERANTIRLARAATRRELQAAATRSEALELAARLIADPPEHIAGMQVGALIASCQRMGDRSAAQLLGRCAPPVSPLRRVEHLTMKRRHHVADALRRAATDGMRRRFEVTAR